MSSYADEWVVSKKKEGFETKIIDTQGTTVFDSYCTHIISNFALLFVKAVGYVQPCVVLHCKT